MPLGMVYAAIDHGTEVIDGNTVEKGIAARMLGWATRLAMAAYEYDVDGQNRPVLTADGTLSYKYDPANPTQALVKNDAAEARLKRFVSNLDVMRQLMIEFGYGPMGHDQFDPYATQQ
jgi:hypothetical protein